MTQKEKHLNALNCFAERIKKDPSVIALLLYGSLAYGTVWERSDIDVELIVRDGTETPKDWLLIEEAGVEFEIVGYNWITKFKNYLQKVRGSFDHAIYGEGTLVFSKDEALYEMMEEARTIGKDDAPKVFAATINGLLNWMYKAEKHITVIKNPLYAQRFLQLAASLVAEMELIRVMENPNREAIIRAMQLNPTLMHEVYVIPSTTSMTEKDIHHTLKVLDDYLMQHMDWWSKHIIRFLSDGEVKTYSHISKQLGNVPLKYLEEKGVLVRVTKPAQLFKKSKLTIDEIAYIYHKEEQ